MLQGLLGAADGAEAAGADAATGAARVVVEAADGGAFAIGSAAVRTIAAVGVVAVGTVTAADVVVLGSVVGSATSGAVTEIRRGLLCELSAADTAPLDGSRGLEACWRQLCLRGLSAEMPNFTSAERALVTMGAQATDTSGCECCIILTGMAPADLALTILSWVK